MLEFFEMLILRKFNLMMIYGSGLCYTIRIRIESAAHLIRISIKVEFRIFLNKKI